MLVWSMKPMVTRLDAKVPLAPSLKVMVSVNAPAARCVTPQAALKALGESAACTKVTLMFWLSAAAAPARADSAAAATAWDSFIVDSMMLKVSGCSGVLRPVSAGAARG